MALTTHPHLVLKLKKEESHTFTPPLDLCGLFYGELTFINNMDSVTKKKKYDGIFKTIAIAIKYAWHGCSYTKKFHGAKSLSST